MPGLGGILLQLAAEPRDVGVDRPPADRRTTSPHLAEQLRARSDRPAAPHECQQEPELGAGDSHRLAFAQHRLSGRLQEDTSKSNGSGQSGCGARLQTAGLPEQLLHPGDQLPHHRGIRGAGAIEVGGSAMSVRLWGHWRRYLELVDDGPALGISVRLMSVAGLILQRSSIGLVPGLVLVVYDEDSRNASIVGGRRRKLGSARSAVRL